MRDGATGIGATGADRDPQLAGFRARCEHVAGVRLEGEALHAFSVERLEEFWRTFLLWTELPWSGSADVVLTGDDVETAQFFPGVRLNYAEALLRPLPAYEDRIALSWVHPGRPAERLTRADLRTRVQRTANALTELGLRAGERMVLIASNTAEAAITALAGAAVGAVVSTATPDMGTTTLLGRFAQLEPALLVVDRVGMPAEAVSVLQAGLRTVRGLVALDDLPLPRDSTRSDRLADVVAGVSPTPVPWERRPFDSALFVMFSSGTTGPPKAMVHGAGGTLLEHVKEHRLHGDLGPDDTLYFHTTTAWMMWHWQLSALAVGAHVVLYDGPVAGPGTLWELVAEEGVTVFGTSPAYLQLCQDAGYRPADAVDLCRLRAVLSTGGVLHDWQYDWAADAIGAIPLQSISGGTDILGCFVLGSPERPVRRGRSQVRSLGLDVAAVDEDGRELVGAVGELVCRRPFPSRPIGLLQDPDGTRFHASYFARHPGMWTHGDLVDFDTDGSARLHGRSDGVLNIDGVRIGPSEIRTVLRGLPEVADTMAVEQRVADQPGTCRMVLLVVLRPGATMDRALARSIRQKLRVEGSPAHVPSLVVAVPELPVTHNGKYSERAARDAVNGDPVVNRDALRNPESTVAITTAVHGDAGPGSFPVPPTGGPMDVGLAQAASRIWCEVLGIGDAAVDGDFTDLGGTSRQAMSLLRRVELDLGVHVPVQRFAQRPTLHGLLDAILEAGSATAETLVVLRPGRGRPLVLLSDAWGQLNLYAALVEHLDTTRPIHGLRLSLVDEADRAKNVPELVQDAIASLLRVQPEGPYSLLGYSFGGVVAHEVAVALGDLGHRVSYLGLIDVLPPDAAMTRRERAARRGATVFESVTSGNLVRAVLRRLDRRVEPGTTRSEWEMFWRAAEVLNRHVPSAYGGAVTYYLAEERLPVVGNNLEAWRRVAPHLMVTEVPGRHWDRGERHAGVLSARNAEVLAARISATLR
ncbi:acetoacetate--CoA ligase [Blastococcus sp. HT6-30]|uniref:acetoacetate--CoA ligase n=1 Tax=Blastococcus sp. HT6-30 TaxID=3144843 RepID=UPI00321BD575